MFAPSSPAGDSPLSTSFRTLPIASSLLAGSPWNVATRSHAEPDVGLGADQPLAGEETSGYGNVQVGASRPLKVRPPRAPPGQDVSLECGARANAGRARLFLTRMSPARSARVQHPGRACERRREPGRQARRPASASSARDARSEDPRLDGGDREVELRRDLSVRKASPPAQHDGASLGLGQPRERIRQPEELRRRLRDGGGSGLNGRESGGELVPGAPGRAFAFDVVRRCVRS
jgi:hypothetical protein